MTKIISSAVKKTACKWNNEHEQPASVVDPDLGLKK
jgi:hypothetical protein